jgi:hypothetical protein
MKLAEVVPFERTNFMDIPACLEKTAQHIRDGEMGEVDMLMVIAHSTDGTVETRGFGDLSSQLVALGLLALATDSMLRD